MEIKTTYFSHGKILISGEYLVMDGATAFTVPTWRGQSMEVIETEGKGEVCWQSKNSENENWFESKFTFKENSFSSSTKNKTSTLIEGLFNHIKELKPNFISRDKNYSITTYLEFPNNWGLGSSSSFIANLAKWAQVDAFDLFRAVLDGSGYDIAVAQTGRPLMYALENQKAVYETVLYNPKFLEDLFFIHLGKKQTSSKEVARYKSKAKPTLESINRISQISDLLFRSTQLKEFENLIQEHERIVSEILNTKPIKEKLFKDYPGAIKSLGAWGGDFVLATRKDHMSYFYDLGYKTIIPWNELIKP